jgi:hypothetical protein
MSDEEEKPKVEFIDVVLNSHMMEETEPEETVAYEIAKWVMQNFEPGFVIVGSPDMIITPSGLLYPNQIGIVMNDKVQVTKSTLANILAEITAELGADINKLEQFLDKARRTQND